MESGSSVFFDDEERLRGGEYPSLVELAMKMGWNFWAGNFSLFKNTQEDT